MLLFTCFVRENIAFSMHYVGMSKLNTTFCVWTSFGITFIAPSIVLLSLCSIKWSMQCVNLSKFPVLDVSLAHTPYFGIVCHRVQNQNKQTRKEATVSLWALGEISPFPSSKSCLRIFVSNRLPYIFYRTWIFFLSFLVIVLNLVSFILPSFQHYQLIQGPRPSTRSWPTYVFCLPIQL
jgi:hypothetical protein